ncbi:MAG: DUF167 domain-containing protein [Bacillota bacterium]
MSPDGKAENLQSLFRGEKGGVVFRVRLTPRASKNEIVGLADNHLRVRVNAPPVEGKANQALLKILSKVFDTPASRFCIVHGESSREKTIRIEGGTVEAAVECAMRVLKKDRSMPR